MKRIIYQSLAAIGLMGIAYYLNRPKKYNKMAGNLKQKIKDRRKELGIG